MRRILMVAAAENSILAGGGYCIYGGARRGTGHTGPVTITNNRFTRLYHSNCGQYGPSDYSTPNEV